MQPVIALRPESSPGRFEVWDAAPSRRAPILESVCRTFTDARQAADDLVFEWGGRWIVIDTWQADSESQHVYQARYGLSCDACGGPTRDPEQTICLECKKEGTNP